MGLFADLASGKFAPQQQSFATYKEEPRPVRNRGATTSLSGGEASFVRLLQAFRSNAPGGWSDNRWEQTVRHYVGIQYVAINRKCEQLSQSEFKVYQKDDNHPDGKRPVSRQHEGYKLHELLENPNEEDSFGDLMFQYGLQLDLTGTALTWMVPNRLGSIMEMYPVPTALAIPQTVMNAEFPQGYYRIQPIYPYGAFTSMAEGVSATGATIPAQWMVRIKHPHPFLRYDGYSPLTALRLHIDEVESIDRSRFYSMKKSVNPSAVLNTEAMEGSEPLPSEEIDRIRAEFAALHQGPENHGNLLVPAPGARLDLFGMVPKDMDYMAGWNQLVSFVLGGFGITKPAAGMIEDASYSTLFATLKQLHLLTLKPICARIGAKLTKKLAPLFGDDLIIEIECPRIDDHDLLLNKLSFLGQGQCLTKNEARKELGFAITQDDWGKQMWGEKAQDEMGGLAALLGGALQGQGPTGAPEQQGPPEQAEQNQGRERPGPLGAGSRGPMKSLNWDLIKKSQDLVEKSREDNKRTRKSLYHLAREVMSNGH